MENTESILAPMAGEEAIVHERLVSVTSAGEGEIVAISRHSEGNNNFIPKNLLLSNQEDIVGLAFQLNNEKSIQSYPSPEFLNSLPFIKKFYPLPAGAREKFIKVSHDNSCNSRHSEAHSPSAKKLQKTRRSARLFCNFEDTFNANENSSEPKESSLFIV